MQKAGGRHNSRHAVFLAALILSCTLFACPELEAAGDSPPITNPPPAAGEIVVLLELDRETAAESFIAVQKGQKLHVPICAFAEVLSLAITCQEQRAYGFVLQESRPFVIDLQEGYAISGREVFPLDGSGFMQDGQLFVETGALSRWLPIDFTFRADSSLLQLHAREVLPLQGFRMRQRLSAARPVVQPKHHKDVTSARAVASVPTADVASQLQLSSDHSTGVHRTLRNSLDLSGDLLYMSQELHFLAKDEKLERLDATLFRRSVDTFHLGPLPLTHIALGATQAPYVDGVGASTRPMYGLYLSNRPINGASEFLSHDIHGYLPQGWDAELFHNGTQIAYQPPTAEGMYHFVNLRVYYGINQFKVILHGPFGERRESEEVFVSDMTTPTGELFYTLSAGRQAGWTQNEEFAGLSRESNLTLTSDFGIARNLSGSFTAVSYSDYHGEQHDYAVVALRTALRYTLLSLEAIQSFSPNRDGNGQLFTVRSSSRNVFGLNLEVVQRFLNDYLSPQFPSRQDPLRTITTLKGNSSFTLLDQIRMPYSMEIGVNTRESGEVEATSQARISGGWNGWNAALEADVSHFHHSVYAAALLQVSTKQRDISIRGQAGYSFAPTITPSAINLSADKELGRKFQLNTALSHDPVANVSALRVGVSKGVGYIGYSLAAMASTDGAFGVDVGARTSIAADTAAKQVVISAEPLSPYGMVAVSAVLAELAEGAGKAVPGVGFLVNGSRAGTVTGSRGGTVIAFLQPDIPVDVSVDLATVEDPFMVPVEEGCRVTPRAGVVSACKFSFTSGGEIDGMVSARLKSGEAPLKGVRVDLEAQEAGGAKLHASSRSEDSGYFLFKSVKPGSYRIVIPDAEVARLKAAPVQPLEVTMPTGGDMVSGQNFYLLPAASVPGVILRPPADEMLE
ncbi:MAG TPA: hypothetical protein DCZ75_05070 [Geobacter sp.]|nr:hypothetical protein [Geobacter sp.]